MADINRYLNKNESATHWMQVDDHLARTEFDQARKCAGRPPTSAKGMDVIEFKRPGTLDMDDIDSDSRKWTDAGWSAVSLITEHILSHPFIVLRRQCQVNNKLTRYHIQPFTLLPVIVSIHRWQGATCLWKGVGSVLVIKGMTLAIQDLVSKITYWPKEVTLDDSGKCIAKHLLLKFVTLAIITPFYSASLLETVQSDIASEKTAFFDIFKEGLRRMISFGYPQKGRMLPVWSLIVPTAVYFILRHVFSVAMKSVVCELIVLNKKSKHSKQGAFPKSVLNKDNQYLEFTSSLAATVSADMVLYPLETILHRLHLQGTRTIIDHLDDGSSVTPILTNFANAVDCYETTMLEEGGTGLYKGFGALVLQSVAYVVIAKACRFAFARTAALFSRDGVPPPRPPPTAAVRSVKQSSPIPIQATRRYSTARTVSSSDSEFEVDEQFAKYYAR